MCVQILLYPSLKMGCYFLDLSNVDICLYGFNVISVEALGRVTLDVNVISYIIVH